jgi:hypothetical protein
MNISINELRKSLKLPSGEEDNNVSKIRKKAKGNIIQDTNLSWGQKRKLKNALKDVMDSELSNIIDVAEELSQKKSDKKKQKIEQRIKKSNKSILPSIGLIAGGLVLGGLALIVKGMMPRPLIQLPLIPSSPFDGPNMALFPPMQIPECINNPIEGDIKHIASNGFNMLMGVAGACLLEAIRPKTSEELEQKEHNRVKLLQDKIATLNINSKAYDDIKNDKTYKNLIISREAKSFFNTVNDTKIDSIVNDDNFTVNSYDDFDAKIQEVITSDDTVADTAGVKVLYQEFKNLPRIKETNPSEEDLQKHFTEKLFTKVIYNKLRDSFIPKDALTTDAKDTAPHIFDSFMKNSSLKKLYLDNLLNANSKEDTNSQITSIIDSEKNNIDIEDLSADNLNEKLPELLAFIGDNKDTREAIIKLVALNHANNLDATYNIIKDNRHLL